MSNEMLQPQDPISSKDLLARHDALASKIQESPQLPSIKPSKFVGITLTPRYKNIITALEDLGPTSLERETVLVGSSTVKIVEYLLRTIIRIGETNSPSGELNERGEFRGDGDQIIFEYRQINHFNELIIRRLLIDWRKKGII